MTRKWRIHRASLRGVTFMDARKPRARILLRVKRIEHGECWAGSRRVCRRIVPIVKCLQDMFSVLRKTAGIMKVHKERNGNGWQKGR